MKKRNEFLCVFLCSVFVWISGCSISSTELATPQDVTSPTLAPEIVEYLQIPDSLLESLTNSIQSIDKISEEEHSTVQVKQSLGNTQELYILYCVTFPEENLLTSVDPNALPVSSVTLSGTTGSVIPLTVDGKTGTFLSYFENPTQGWEGKEVQFKLTSGLSNDTHEVSWRSTAQGEIIDGNVHAENGETIGSISLSPFSLRFSISRSEAEDAVVFLDSIAIIDQSGTATQPKGGRGVSSSSESSLQSFSGSIDFKHILDLSTVTAVQIDGHTVTLK